jgi:hypothetical protein
VKRPAAHLGRADPPDLHLDLDPTSEGEPVVSAQYPNNKPPDGRAGPGREWRSEAACRGSDPELFFPTAEADQARKGQVAAAKAVCARCPVRQECLTEALARIPYGIAGGLTEQERRRLRTGRQHQSQHSQRDGGLSAEAVEVLTDGPRRGMTGRQRAGIGRALLASGRSARQVARACGVTERTAARWAATTTHPTATAGSGEGSSAATGLPSGSSQHTHAQAGTRAPEGIRG